MDVRPVREAYSTMSGQYIALVDDERQMPEQDRSLIRRHLTNLPGIVLDLGCGPGHWTAYLHSLGVDVTRAPARSVIARHDGIGSPVAGVGKKLDS